MKILARCSFLLVTILWGSFYAVAKVALTHIDPIIFTLFEALTLVPIALTLLIMQRHTLTLAACKRGVLLGSCLCIATLTITVSEKFTGATNTAFFPSTGGIFAAVIAATVLRRSLSTSIWVAGVLSLLGVLLILHASLSGSELRGDVIALLGALLFTVYLFLVEQDASREGPQFWAIVGVEHLSFAFWMLLFSLLFGDWQHMHLMLTQDIPVVLYVALACTFLPVVLTHFAHRSLDPLETGFLSILEPLWGVIIAHVSLGEVVPRSLYLGGGLIMAGTLVHLFGAVDLRRSFQMLIGLGQRGFSCTYHALTQWVHLEWVLLFLSRMMALLSQKVSLVSVSLFGYSYGYWARHQFRNGYPLSAGFRLILNVECGRGGKRLITRLSSLPAWGTILAEDRTWLCWSTTPRSNLSFQPCSFWRGSSFHRTTPLVLRTSRPALGWVRQSQQCASP